MDEEHWRRYRRRARQRAAAQGLLILGPVAIVVVALGIFGPTDHPAGDVRDDPLFRVVTAGFFIAFWIAMMVGSVRLLRRNADDGDS